MEVVFVSAEIAPFSGRGPTAEICAALPKALRGLQHHVLCVSPLYPHIDPSRHSLARRLTSITFELAGEKRSCELYHGRTAGGVELNFIGHESAFRTATPINQLADGDDELAAQRGGIFAAAVRELLLQREHRADIVMGQDWPGALAVRAIRECDHLSPVKLLLGAHSPHSPAFPARLAPHLGIDEPASSIDALAFGIETADRTVVSSQHAAAALRRNHPKMARQILTIPCGIDSAIWNPVTDPHLFARYDALEQSGKERCRGDVQRELGLPLRNDVPIVGLWGSAEREDGLDLIVALAPALLRNDIQLIIAHEPNSKLKAALREFTSRWPDRLQSREAPHEGALVHRILAASDLVLVPRRNAETGSEHLCAHRYGAIPVAPRDGVYGDGLVDCDPALSTGNAFLFDELTPDAILGATQRGVAAFADRDVFDRLRTRVMRVDHSWERSARLYDGVFRELAASTVPESVPSTELI